MGTDSTRKLIETGAGTGWGPRDLRTSSFVVGDAATIELWGL